MNPNAGVAEGKAVPAAPRGATTRVREILSWYASDNPGTKANLARMMNHGLLAGTGRMVILPEPERS